MSSTPSPAWQSANSVEWALHGCLSRADGGGYLQVLATAVLYLPGRADGRVLTTRQDGVTHLVVFTSPETWYRAAAGIVDGWRPTGLADLARSWPDDAWGLAVSPDTPVGAYLSREQVAAIGAVIEAQPPFVPAGPIEELMRVAVRSADPGVYLALLAGSRVLVHESGPGSGWRIDHDEDGPYIAAYTSPQRLRADGGDPAGAVTVEFAELARGWPDPTCRLAVNPGSAIEAAFNGARLPDLPRLVR